MIKKLCIIYKKKKRKGGINIYKYRLKYVNLLFYKVNMQMMQNCKL